MSEKMLAGCGCNAGAEDSADQCCIHTNKIYDSCREKDCLEDLKVFFCKCDQQTIENAMSIKARKAEIIWVSTDVEEVPFNRGFFTVDLKYFFRITFDVYTGVNVPAQIDGLATFSKRVILFGSEGKTKSFSSQFKDEAQDPQFKPSTNAPIAVVDVVQPIVLASRLVDICDLKCSSEMDCDLCSVPCGIANAFRDSLTDCEGNKRVFVSLGIFTIVRLEREVQLLLDNCDFCLPDNECIEATAENPCELFDRIRFPLDEFFPPKKQEFENTDFFNHHECCCD